MSRALPASRGHFGRTGGFGPILESKDRRREEGTRIAPTSTRRALPALPERSLMRPNWQTTRPNRRDARQGGAPRRQHQSHKERR